MVIAPDRGGGGEGVAVWMLAYKQRWHHFRHRLCKSPITTKGFLRFLFNSSIFNFQSSMFYKFKRLLAVAVKVIADVNPVGALFILLPDELIIVHVLLYPVE